MQRLPAGVALSNDGKESKAATAIADGDSAASASADYFELAPEQRLEVQRRVHASSQDKNQGVRLSEFSIVLDVRLPRLPVPDKKDTDADENTKISQASEP